VVIARPERHLRGSLAIIPHTDWKSETGQHSLVQKDYSTSEPTEPQLLSGRSHGPAGSGDISSMHVSYVSHCISEVG